MTTLSATVALLLHAALMILGAPLLLGVLRLGKARLIGRSGPPVMQPWRDLTRLLRKQPVIADSASPIFRGAPYVCVAAMGVAALLTPSFTLGMVSAPLADLILIAGLMGLARAALVLAAMDTGTAFGGLGASRETMFAIFAEPAFLLVVLTLALLAGSSNLDLIAASVREGEPGLHASLALALAALVAVALAENGRMPVDNPASHLELTMVHEAMLLEYSGRHLALMEYAAALRLLVWFDLIGTLFLPFGLAPANATAILWLGGLFAWGCKLAVLAAILAVWETLVAKLRVFRVPELLGTAILLGVLAAVLLFVTEGLA